MSDKRRRMTTTNTSNNISIDTDLTLKQKAQELGKIGVILGARENAALYIAGLFLLTIVALLGLVMIFDPSLRPDVVATLSTVAAAALGYIGGLIKK